MATDNKTNINLVGLDYDEIAANLKEFLKTQDVFRDYEFDGAVITALIRVLAANDHYAAIYAHFGINEAFLKTAALRGNVASRAQEIGYVPRAYTAAAARVLLSLSYDIGSEPGDEAVVDKGTKFTSRIGTRTFTFSTVESISIPNDGGVYAKEIDIYQGNFVTFTYTVDKSNPLQRFIIPNNNVDTRFLTVTVAPNSASTIRDVYTKAEDVNLLTGTDAVFFLSESWDGFPEVEFGDGILGKALENGNVVRLEYLVTQGPEANGARTFGAGGDVAGAAVVAVETVDPANSGDTSESLESVKFTAPKVWQAQNRGVTSNDFIGLLKRDYPNIDDLAVWGGQDHKPFPRYGKAFVAIKPKAGFIFSNALKERIKTEILTKYNIVAIRPEIVDPDYMFIHVDTSVRYDPKRTNLTANAIGTKTKTAIESFFDEQVNRFGRELSFSKLTAAIDDCDVSILDNNTTLELEKRFAPVGSRTNYTIYFSNPVTPGSLRSSEFVIDGLTYKFMDSPVPPGPHSTGTIKVYRRLTSGAYVFQNENQGTIDYRTGEINITNFLANSLPSSSNGYIRLFVKPLKDISVRGVTPDANIYTNMRDQIITLDTETFEYPIDVTVAARTR